MTRKSVKKSKSVSNAKSAPKVPLSQREKAFMKLYSEGLSYARIARSINPHVSKLVVMQVLDSCVKKGYDVTDGKRRKYIPTIERSKYDKRIIDLWPKDGICTISEIARKAGVSPCVVYRVRDRYDLPFVKQNAFERIPADIKKSICSDYENGMTTVNLCTQHDIHPTVLYKILLGKFGTLESARKARAKTSNSTSYLFTERAKRFTKMYADGKTYEEIGLSCDPPITKERVRQILSKAAKQGYKIVRGPRDSKPKSLVMKDIEIEKRILAI